MSDSKKYLTDAALQQALSIADLTETHSTAHAVRLIMNEVLEGLARAGWPQAQIQSGPRVVSAEENYGLLGYDPTEVTLGSAHTRWVDEHSLLRTQTTSQIPIALKHAAQSRKPGALILLAAPGITFRRDSRDRWHCAEPHQMDIWVVGEPELSSREHLLRLVGDVLNAATPDKPWIYSDSPHHYTEGGIEVNVMNDGSAVEVLECGLIATSLLQRLGIDPQRHGGLALGMGLDRLAMLRKGIPDIRLLRDPNERVQAQMHDLRPWNAVSRLPSISRDISVAVTPGLSEEVLTEKMLQAAGDCSGWIEEMQVKGRWISSELPSQAIERLGLLPDQENILLRVVLRDCSRSITTAEANALYEKIQAALHEGAPGAGYRMELSTPSSIP
ncbi:phenylalanyl-tRNA synthetase subunit alpha [Pseudomonas chlororaphis]|uniref:Phenylalanyl-tRNA synthetase n=1 Tax=Pseudomonas chlororaphis TaxID=587753 RepID=A0A0G3GKT5_9PSED|nr:phenylalanyl-tRNA synthetase subunit alpha [Pseudomonas chlororaphis]